MATVTFAQGLLFCFYYNNKNVKAVFLQQPWPACAYVCECVWKKKGRRGALGCNCYLEYVWFVLTNLLAASKNSSVNHASPSETVCTPLYVFSRDPDVSN